MQDIYRKVIAAIAIRVMFVDQEMGGRLLAMQVIADASLGRPFAIENGEIRYSREHVKASTNDELFEALFSEMAQCLGGPRP